jgi:phage FluMu protein Com
MMPSAERTDSYIEIDPRKEIRCPTCNKLFGKGELGEGTSLELKCPRCKTIIRFRKL